MTSWSLIQCVLISPGKGAGTRQQTLCPRNVLLQRAVVELLVILSLFTLVFFNMSILDHEIYGLQRSDVVLE